MTATLDPRTLVPELVARDGWSRDGSSPTSTSACAR